MAYAVTHILVPLIIFSLLRHYVFGKGKMPTYVVLIAGLAGLAPDLDIVLTWINHFITGSHTNLHGSFTHSFFLPILFGLIGIAFYTGKQIRATYIWCAVAFGWLTHVLLDVLYRHGIGKALGWPFTNQMILTSPWNLYQYGVHIDSVLLVLWLIHEQFAHQIKDYF